MALGSTHPQAAWPMRLAITLFAIVLAAAPDTLGVGVASATDAAASAVESKAVGSHLVTVEDTRHSHHDCGYDHESAECSPCSSCSAGLPSTTGPSPDVMIVLRAPVLKLLYDDVVPGGIRRPPRPS